MSPRTSLGSRVPAFTVTTHPADPGWLIFTCPRGKCGGAFAVTTAIRESSPSHDTRPCPYCFKVARL